MFVITYERIRFQLQNLSQNSGRFRFLFWAKQFSSCTRLVSRNLLYSLEGNSRLQLIRVIAYVRATSWCDRSAYKKTKLPNDNRYIKNPIVSNAFPNASVELASRLAVGGGNLHSKWDQDFRPQSDVTQLNWLAKWTISDSNVSGPRQQLSQHNNNWSNVRKPV